MKITLTTGLAGVAFCLSFSTAAVAAPQCDLDNGGITLPEGFCALVAADELGPARHAVVAANGDLYVALRVDGGNGGGAMALHDSKGDGRFDIHQKFGTGSNTGIGIYGGYLYLAQPTQVIRYKLVPGHLIPEGQPEVVVSGFDPARSHADKGLTLDGRGALYVNIGSPSNACQVRDRAKGSPGRDPCPVLERHSGIWKFDAGKLGQTQDSGTKIVTGLRQEPDIAWAYGAVYTVMNNRDQIDEFYPESFTAADNNDGPAEVLYRADPGANFGWPYCYFDFRYQKLLLAPEYGGDGKAVGRCASGFTLPIASYPAHWAPVDLNFYQGSQFPTRYKGGAFIAFHGSWNRTSEQRPSAIVFQPFANGKPSGHFEIFASDFGSKEPVKSLADYKARADGVAVAPDGSLYVTDSVKGKVWRVFYRG